MRTPAWGACSARRAGQPACGQLAYLADKDLGLDSLLACDDRSRFVLGGTDSPRHLFGMTQAFWDALAWKPGCRAGSLGVVDDATPLLPRTGIAMADGSTYLPRKPGTHAPETTELTFQAPGNAAIVVTNVLGGYELFDVVSASAGGVARQPATRDDVAQLFAPVAGVDAPVQWRVAVRTTHAGALDVVSVPAREARSLPGCTAD